MQWSGVRSKRNRKDLAEIIDECAGILGGIDPRPFSLRQLIRMCDGKQMIQWDHTAAICATIINMHHDPRKGSPANPRKMDPYRNAARSGEKPMIKLNSKDSMKLLKRVFIDHAPPTLEEIQNGKF